MQIVSNRDTLHEIQTLSCVCVCVCVCVVEGGGGLIFDPLTFTTLWANSADDNLFS